MKKESLAPMISAMVFAAGFANAEPLYGFYYDYVMKTHVSMDGHLYITPTGGNGERLAPGHGCNDPWYARSFYDLSHPQTQAMLKIALASQLAHKSVYVSTEGCKGDSDPDAIEDGQDYPILVAMQLQEGKAVNLANPSGGKDDNGSRDSNRIPDDASRPSGTYEP